MITVAIDRSPDALAFYTQIYEAVREQVVLGELRTGEKLPSKRVLANHLDVSVKTVENAYSQLLMEGYIHALPKSGYYVARLEGYRRSNAPAKPYVSKFEETAYTLDVKANTSLPEDFPYAAWAKLGRDALLEHERDMLATAPFNGVRELREAIARHLRGFRGMDVSPDQIVVGSGTEYLYGRIVHLLGEGCVIGMDDPGYSHIKKILTNQQVPYRAIPTTSAGMDVEALRASDCTAVHVSPAHHFPLGTTMSVQTRVDLLTWVNAGPGRYIVEDDYNGEFLYHGSPVPSIYQIDTRQKVIYLNTFSKTVAPSVRAAYMVLPERLMDQYVNTMSFYSSTVSSFVQHQLAQFIEKGLMERYIRRVRQRNVGQRRLVAEVLESGALKGRAHVQRSHAGTHYLVHLDTDRTDREVLDGLAVRGILASFVSQYCELPRPDLDHLLILNYSRATRPELEMLRDALAEALE